MSLDEAINSWNDPNTDFIFGYVCWHGFRRGIQPEFHPEVLNDSIRVHIKSKDFILDKISKQWLSDNNLEDKFINLIQEYKETSESLIDNMTKEINQSILDNILKIKTE